MQDHNPNVAAVVLNCNGKKWLDCCLRTLSGGDYPNLTIYLSDNASTDDSPEWVEKNYPSVKVLKNMQNLGWAGGNNVGIRPALNDGADWVWILNNDIELERDCLSRMMDFIRQNPHIKMLTPIINYFEPRDRVWSCGGTIDYKGCEARLYERIEDFKLNPENRILSGCALMVHKDVFRKIGLIDECFFIYGEDWDFCVRADNAGFKMDVADSALMYHKVGAYSAGADSMNAWKNYQFLRGSLIFWRRHLGFWRFHRNYCPGHLYKWFGALNDEQGKRTDVNDAIIDALWYFLTFKRCPRDWPKSPSWFRQLVRRRGWAIIELMSFRLGSLARARPT